MSATLPEQAETEELKIELIPRPGTPERAEFERTGKLPDGFSDSSMELNWCLAPETLERIKATYGKAKLSMLVVVEHDGVEKNRQVVPFTQGYCQVMLPSVGLNTVHVTAVWAGYDSLYDVLEKKQRGRFQTRVLAKVQPEAEAIKQQIRQTEAALLEADDDAPEWEEQYEALTTQVAELYQQLNVVRDEGEAVTCIDSFDSIHRLAGEATKSVVVDEAMFATHWAITKWLAQLYPVFKRRRSPDGCTDRKRAWVYTAPTLWAYALYLLAKSVGSAVVVLGSMFFGLRKIDLKPVYMPHGRTPFDVQGYNNTSIWWQKSNGHDRGINPLVVLNPPLITLSGVLAAISTFIWARWCFPKLGWTDHFVNIWTHGPWWFYAVVVLGPAIVAAVILGFVLVFTGLEYASEASVVAQLKQRRAAKKKAKRENKWNDYYSRAAELTCGTGEVLKKPAPKKPLLMRPIEAGKMRVCKPNPS